jgi:hypothetical protein
MLDAFYSILKNNATDSPTHHSTGFQCGKIVLYVRKSHRHLRAGVPGQPMCCVQGAQTKV